jgi:crossover junction endodeoxyribonuclease RusA
MDRKRSRRRNREPIEFPAFEVCVPGIPVSAQAKNRARLQTWKARVAAAAQQTFAGPPVRVEIALRVTHYCELPVGDMDNLLKPVQDALQGVVYENDRQVKDALSNRRDINGAFRVRFMSPRLAAAFSAGDEFVHIRVWLSPAKEDLG